MSVTAAAAQRGRLVLAEKVIEKIAGQAASEASSARAKVSVDLAPASANLSITVGIAYPGSIRVATQQIRHHVTSRVEALTGVDVRRVDIEVTFLATDSGPEHRRKALR